MDKSVYVLHVQQELIKTNLLGSFPNTTNLLHQIWQKLFTGDCKRRFNKVYSEQRQQLCWMNKIISVPMKDGQTYLFDSMECDKLNLNIKNSQILMLTKLLNGEIFKFIIQESKFHYFRCLGKNNFHRE